LHQLLFQTLAIKYRLQPDASFIGINLRLVISAKGRNLHPSRITYLLEEGPSATLRMTARISCHFNQREKSLSNPMLLLSPKIFYAKGVT